MLISILYSSVTLLWYFAFFCMFGILRGSGNLGVHDSVNCDFLAISDGFFSAVNLACHFNTY